MALTFNLPSQIVVQTAAQWAADNTVYSNKRILVTSDVYYGATDQRKIKIADGTQTWTNLNYMPISQTLAEVLANGSNTGGTSFKSPNNLTELLVANNNIDAYVDNGSDVSEINMTPNTINISTTGASIDLSATSVTKNSVEIATINDIVQVTTSTIGSAINGATSATPNDTDLVMSVDASVAKKNTWTQVKAFLKTYFDTIYTTTGAVATQITTALSGYLTSATAASTYAVKSNTVLSTYLEVPEQSKPSTPTNAFRLYADTSNRLSWIGENGYVRTFDGTSNTADRTYTLPNESGTIGLISQNITNGVTTSSPSEDAVFDALALKSDKGYTLIGGTSGTSPADSTTYFFGGVQSQGLLAAENTTTKIPVPKTGTIKSVQLSFLGNGSNEASTMLLRLNATTDYTISSTTDMSSSLVANYGLNIAVTQGDTFCFKWTTPAWVTNPANLRFHIVVYIE